MNKNGFHLLIGGVVILAVAHASPWTAISGVLYLWLVHRRTVAVGSLSKPALFRSVAAGGVAGGFIASTLLASIPFLVQSMVSSKGIGHVDDDGVLFKSMGWATFASAGYSVVAAILFAWSTTLVAPYLSEVRRTEQPDGAA